MIWNKTEITALRGKFIGNSLRHAIQDSAIERITSERQGIVKLTTYILNSLPKLKIMKRHRELFQQAIYFQKHFGIKPVHILWFPCPLEKKLPTGAKKTLDVEEINSACTFHNETPFIAIYRWEEAPKVLFHELIHFNRLDDTVSPGQNINIQYLYGINHPIFIQEVYSEVCALLLNLHYNSSLENYPIEFAFMTFQAQKILKFYSVKSIQELHKIQSNTNLIAYFIFKLAYLNTISDIKVEFDRLYRDGFKLKDPHRFIKRINLGLPSLFQVEKIENIPELSETMRMSIIE